MLSRTNVLTYLEDSTRRNPNATAVVDESGTYTYARLLEDTQRIGTALASRGASGSSVIIMLRKSELALACMLGTLQAGAFYVPVDTDAPAHRLQHMAATLGDALVVAGEKNVDAVHQALPERKVLVAEELLRHPVDAEALEAARSHLLSCDPAYVMFTAGSTGTPKGVAVSHGAIASFVDEFVRTFGFTSEDRFANQAPFDFDISVKDVYGSLAVGATLVLVPRELFMQPQALVDYLEKNQVTVMVWAVAALCIASAYHVLSPGRLQSVRQVLFSSEVIPRKHLDAWLKCLPNARFVNLYGPTEITCNCLYHVVDRTAAYPQGLPLGKSFGHCEVLLLDEADQLVTEPGKLGELVVRGPSVALGYVGNPEATARSFVQNPLNSMYHDRVYRTGDLAEMLDSGDLVFRGRRDNQIKYMGHRIELEEVDKAFEDLPGVQRCRCAFDARRQRLRVFFEGTAEEAALPRLVADTLPTSMSPSSITRVDSMPLNKNGKVDRAELLRTYFPTKSKEGR